jgi:hypothetical protein
MTPYPRTDPVDWMNLTASDYLDRYYPTWRRAYQNMLNSRPADWANWLYLQYGRAAPSNYGREPRSDRDYRHERPWDCRCRECDCDHEPCECQCCVGDVDFVIYARLGEQRVIPVVVENPRRREQSVTVELSDWKKRGGGGAPVETISIEPKTFKLHPCGEQEVSIVISIGGKDQERPDVDCCLVAIADLRLDGCDHRPLRIAVAILPRFCSPFKVRCGCACC